ncbi:hypothetical protein IWQ60_012277 [Tieghemiomyces parasiticus]|uniref:Uncharacterized protein n=1 Tax=Tieghemiomyces parasiticus TaxID=78921 RepID=A0A9W7ZQE8_9FUNG|nr:hypothetical protein IWQ60_012277 [Tieghemiomyces parasiticus]
MPVKLGKIDSKYPDALRVRGSILLDILPVVAFLTAFATMITCIQLYANKDLALNSVVIGVLSTTVSLLISLRTNSAYDRFWEARRLWSQITFNIRNLSRNIWILVSETKTSADGCHGVELQLKRAAASMLIAYTYACNDMIAETSESTARVVEFMRHAPAFEDQINRKGQKREGADEYQLRYLRTTDTDTLLARRGHTNDYTRRRRHTQDGRSNPHDHQSYPALPTDDGRSPAPVGMWRRLRDTFSLYLRASWLHRGANSTQTIRRRYRFPKPNMVNIITTHLAVYVQHLVNRGYIDVPSGSNMNASITALVDAFAALERIQLTPMPLAYSVHLHQSTWIFLILLPFQLASTLKWVAVPIVALAAFVLFGTLAIGDQIENPFNGDANDLPITMYCRIIEEELNGITSVPFHYKVENWIPLETLIEEDQVRRSISQHRPASGIPPPNDGGGDPTSPTSPGPKVGFVSSDGLKHAGHAVDG